jgi:hypothetical protein
MARRTKASGSSVPGMVTTGTGDSHHPSVTTDVSVTLPPFFACSMSAMPSGLFTATTAIFGLRGKSRRSGVPHTVVQMPQCGLCPGFTAIIPIAPRCSKYATLPGIPKPSLTTIFPRRSMSESLTNPLENISSALRA